MTKKETVGRKGEGAVRVFLMKHGYDVIASNIRVFQGKQIGEIDILAAKNKVLYIVEVKSTVMQAPEAWVTQDVFQPRKLAKLNKVRKVLVALGNPEAEIGDLEAVRFFLRSVPGLDVELDRAILGGFSAVRAVLARVTVNGAKKYDMEFKPINAGYY